jgi:hypothetical protein
MAAIAMGIVFIALGANWATITGGVVLAAGLVIVPPLMYWIQRCSDSLRLNGFVTKIVYKFLFFALQQMNVPLLEFWVTHFVDQHFEWYHMVPLVMAFFLAQFVTVLIVDDHGWT